MTTAVGVGLRGIADVVVAVGERSADEGTGSSPAGAGVSAPGGRMVGADVDSLPLEHAMMATATTAVSAAPNRDFI